jgi:molybdopterin-guanine dinucleotide biosynthesis protein A
VKNISGVILAGGASSRFGGRTKSNMTVGGTSIISRTVNTLSEIFDEIIIVTNKPDEFQEFRNCRLVSDRYLKVGPLGGIHAGMIASSNPSVFVFGGDMPFISKELIIRQIQYFNNTTCDVLIPKMNSDEEPLHAIYSLSIFIKLDYYLLTRSDYAIKDFLCKVEVKNLNIDETPSNRKIFTNINTPSDLSVADKFQRNNRSQNY